MRYTDATGAKIRKSSGWLTAAYTTARIGRAISLDWILFPNYERLDRTLHTSGVECISYSELERIFAR